MMNGKEGLGLLLRCSILPCLSLCMLVISRGVDAKTRNGILITGCSGADLKYLLR
jgi:hypothetical protein